ncbi:MAG: flagellar protein FliS [Firmicutes bacterium]|nr:flagellar protein FliS [Bacillota bacterium]
MINKEDYTLRIANATPVQLVVINYELLLAFVDEALTAHSVNDKAEYYKKIGKTKEAITQLIEGLDLDNEVAQNLYQLYQYAWERLNKALFTGDFVGSANAVIEVQQMFATLLEGWQQIENTPDDRIAEHQADSKVYAGLTYGKDGLNEYIPQDGNEGFKA